MKLIHKICSKKRVIDLATALAEQALDLPFLAQPLEGGWKVDLHFAETLHVSAELAQSPHAALIGAVCCENDDGRETFLENLRCRIDCPEPAGNHAQIVFGQAA